MIAIPSITKQSQPEQVIRRSTIIDSLTRTVHHIRADSTTLFEKHKDHYV